MVPLPLQLQEQNSGSGWLLLGRCRSGKAFDTFYSSPGPDAFRELKTHSSRTCIKNKNTQMRKLKMGPKGRLDATLPGSDRRPRAGPRLRLLASPHSWVSVRLGAWLLGAQTLWKLRTCGSPPARLPDFPQTQPPLPLIKSPLCHCVAS